jgi:AraC family transcriptional regulator
VKGQPDLKMWLMKALGKKESTQQYLLARLCMAKQFIDDNLIQECSVAQLAKEVRLSEFHFSRCFKEVFGMSPYQYYLTRKIHCSAELLTRPGMDLTGVSLEMGFSELSTFSKRFKKVYGMAPLQYKKSVLYSQAQQEKLSD